MPNDSIIGRLQVTITYTIPVTDLDAYAAVNMDQAARNLTAWYADGTSYIAGDIAQSTDIVCTVVPASVNSSTHNTQ